MNIVLHTDPVPLWLDDQGGVRIRGSRVLLEVLLDQFKQGMSPEALAENFPTVQLADIYTVLGYYFRHQAEVNAYLQLREDEAEALRRKVEAERTTPRFTREKLLQRQTKKE